MHLLKDCGELSCENFFVDGTKIEANANKYTFVWKKTILKHQAKLQDKMHKELPGLLAKYEFKMYLAEEIKAKRLKNLLASWIRLKQFPTSNFPMTRENTKQISKETMSFF